ncbi:Leucine-rich repeat domain, L domain-like [Phytophthora cactorum]|nr:Leucine-rich repeat domain, L domain-like [Phytophthora cactorum]
MDRLEVRALLGESARMEPDLITVDLGINVDDSLGEEAFLKTLEETLQQHVASLGQQFLVLSATQVDRLAFRLNDALVPKHDAETHVIQAWTIQPQLQLKVKASAHIQVLKLSTILREVQKLRLHQSQTEEAQNPIEVEIFPSLRVIEVLNTKTRGLQNVHYFANQLREFHIEHTEVTTLRRLLAPTKEEQKPWRKLLKLQMNCCELQILDDSVNLLRAVKTLDLGWNKIEKVETDVTTKSLQVLNLCHNQLRHVPSIQSLRSLRELDLAVNQISSLKGLETLTALERLDVSHNLIEDIAEVELLTSLPRLTYLKMEFNPIARRPDYEEKCCSTWVSRSSWTGSAGATPSAASLREAYGGSLLKSLCTQGSSPKWHRCEEPEACVGIPPLPRSQSVSAHFVEIQNPPSTLPTKSDNASNTAGNWTESSDSSSKSSMNSQGSESSRPPILTVDDYFRTQRDVIVMKVKKERKQSDDQATTSEEEDSDDSSTGTTRKRSRKYTASDFMRDFEEEELLVREGNDFENVDALVARSTSQTQISSPQAAELDLHFGIDGVPANVEIKSRELIERFTVSDDKDPIAITRWLPSIVAVGTSMHSSRAKIITMKLRPRGSSSVADAAYQFDAVASLGTLLTPLVARLYQQYKGHIMICNCANCGALSLLTPKYPARTEADEMLMVYSCLLCSSCNVRETSFKKLIALCANEGVTIPSSIPLAPPPWETITEGFYIEEPAATDPSSMRECVMVSCNGIREVAAPTAELGRNDERTAMS